MKGQMLIIILIASSILLAPYLSLAQDFSSSVMEPNTISENNIEYSNEQVCQANPDMSCSITKRKFHERLSYTGNCDWLPKGSICLTYSDNYKWIVPDYRIDCFPLIVGNSNCKPIELIRCYYADYYHIIGTSLVMSIPRPEKISIRYVPLTCMQGQCGPS